MSSENVQPPPISSITSLPPHVEAITWEIWESLGESYQKAQIERDQDRKIQENQYRRNQLWLEQREFENWIEIAEIRRQRRYDQQDADETELFTRECALKSIRRSHTPGSIDQIRNDFVKKVTMDFVTWLRGPLTFRNNVRRDEALAEKDEETRRRIHLEEAKASYNQWRISNEIDDNVFSLDYLNMADYLESPSYSPQSPEVGSPVYSPRSPAVVSSIHSPSSAAGSDSNPEIVEISATGYSVSPRRGTNARRALF